MAKAKTTTKKTTTKKTKTANKPKKMSIVSFLLDETTSMSGILDETVTGFNSYINELKTSLKDQEVYYSLIKFNTTRIEMTHVGCPLNDVITLSRENYRPSGWTNLIDACVETIKATDELTKKYPSAKVLVVFQTDGEENKSTKYNKNQLVTMISERKELGWQFAFLGAGIDSYGTAASFGIDKGATVSYGLGLSEAVFTATANSTSDLMRGLAPRMNYSAGAKMSMGDRYDPDLNTSKLDVNDFKPYDFGLKSSGTVVNQTLTQIGDIKKGLDLTKSSSVITSEVKHE